MRLGTLFSLQDPSGRQHQELYDAALRQIVEAEAQGYDWVNVTEHRFAPDGYLPGSFSFLAAAAALTRRIRLSTGMLLLPQHHPLRVAEEAAVVDLISHGRLTLGVALGYRPVEFEALGIDIRKRGKRFNESLEILRLAWSGEPFSWQGEIFQIPEIVVRPRPVQRPGIPLWLGGGSEVAMRRAVRWKSPLFPGASESMDSIRGMTSLYDRFREEAGWSDPREIVLPRLAVVAETTTEARRLALPAITSMLETYASWGSAGQFEVLESWDLLDEMVLVGSEEHCLELMARYGELGVTDMMLQFAIPTLTPQTAAESQQRLAAATGISG